MFQKVILLALGLVIQSQAWTSWAAVAVSTTRIHDPSTIIQCGKEYWVFATGPGIVSQFSKDLREWRDGPPVWTEATFPNWKAELVPANKGHLWAPDIIFRNNRYWLYYSVSTIGKRVSAIGLATNLTLNPKDPRYGWRDAGVVVSTTEEDNHNAIDPSIVLDAGNRPWMAYGSYWSGIKLVELDPETGLRASTNSPVYPLAWKEKIEACCLYRKGNQYYLFLNWGQCCRGTNSTYEIRVGRSDAITGPYLDREGKDMRRGGGTLFLETEGRRIGPGHPAILKKGKKEHLSYHYYDGENNGRATLEVAPLKWKDGWPVAGKPIRR